MESQQEKDLKAATEQIKSREQLALEYKDVKEAIKSLTEQEAKLKAELMMDVDEGKTVQFGRAIVEHVCKTMPKRVDWQGVVEELNGPAEVEKIKAQAKLAEGSKSHEIRVKILEV